MSSVNPSSVRPDNNEPNQSTVRHCEREVRDRQVAPVGESQDDDRDVAQEEVPEPPRPHDEPRPRARRAGRRGVGAGAEREGGGEVEGEAEEEEEEAEAQRPLRDPGSPSKAEWDEHMLTHIPTRPWCPHCLRGKGKDSPSLRVTGNFAENLVRRI